MANSNQSRKRARQAVKRRAHNMSLRSMMRTCLKSVVTQIESKNKEGAQAAFKVAEPALDRMVSKGLIHKNKAARHKSRLNAKIKAL